MTTSPQVLKVMNDIKIVSYALIVPVLAYYIAILARMLKSKHRRNLMPLIIVSVLMIVTQIA